MRFTAKVDETGKAKTIKLDDMEIKQNTRRFQVVAGLNEVTIVSLELQLVEIDLDLENVEIKGEENVRS